ncbi:hypothetical protein ACXZ7B_05110 [Vibrio owensii]
MMKVIYNDYFITKAYFKDVKEKYNCICTSEFRENNTEKGYFNLVISCLFLMCFGKYFKKEGKVLLFDITDPVEILSSLVRYRPKHISVWLWNSVNSKSYKFKVLNVIFYCLDCRVYTFDFEDSKKHRFKFYNQVVSMRYLDKYKLLNNKIESDIFFYGLDKGRGEYISKNVMMYEAKSDINIVKDETTQSGLYETTDKCIDYDEYLSRVSTCKAVLDITKEDQSGLTLRTLEALYLNKKVITNNSHVYSLDIYDRDWIYIIDIDERSITEFLNNENNERSHVSIKYDINSLLEFISGDESGI